MKIMYYCSLNLIPFSIQTCYPPLSVALFIPCITPDDSLPQSFALYTWLQKQCLLRPLHIDTHVHTLPYITYLLHIHISKYHIIIITLFTHTVPLPKGWLYSCIYIIKHSIRIRNCWFFLLFAYFCPAKSAIF